MAKMYGVWAAVGLMACAAPAAAEPPAYQTIHLEQDVARPAAQVWARVGRFCDIGEWLHVSCRLVGGKDGEVGAVRDLDNGRVTEVIVGRTDLSYTYAMPDGLIEGQGFYHGNLAVVPVSKSTSRLVYSILYLDKGVGGEAGIKERRDKRVQRFGEGLKTMKMLSEAKPR